MYDPCPPTKKMYLLKPADGPLFPGHLKLGLCIISLKGTRKDLGRTEMGQERREYESQLWPLVALAM